MKKRLVSCGGEGGMEEGEAEAARMEQGRGWRGHSITQDALRLRRSSSAMSRLFFLCEPFQAKNKCLWAVIFNFSSLE